MVVLAYSAKCAERTDVRRGEAVEAQHVGEAKVAHVFVGAAAPHHNRHPVGERRPDHYLDSLLHAHLPSVREATDRGHNHLVPAGLEPCLYGDGERKAPGGEHALRRGVDASRLSVTLPRGNAHVIHASLCIACHAQQQFGVFLATLEGAAPDSAHSHRLGRNGLDRDSADDAVEWHVRGEESVADHRPYAGIGDNRLVAVHLTCLVRVANRPFHTPERAIAKSEPDFPALLRPERRPMQKTGVIAETSAYHRLPFSALLVEEHLKPFVGALRAVVDAHRVPKHVLARRCGRRDVRRVCPIDARNEHRLELERVGQGEAADRHSGGQTVPIGYLGRR